MISDRSSVVTTVILASAALLLPASAKAAEGAGYFKGKTVTWIVGSGAGGGHDFFARLLARHMETTMPGTTFVVVNRPGAGHVIAGNLIWSARPNGLTIGSFSTGLLYAQIQKKKGLRFDLAKMSWIGKAQSDPRVLSVAKNSDLKTAEDIFGAKRQLKFSASGVGGGSYNDAFMFGKAYNLPYRILVGYSGTESPLAMVRGETDILMGSMSSAEQWVRAGHLKVILQFGKAMKGVPDARDFARTPTQIALSNMMENQGRLSRIAAGPPGIPQNRLTALREGYRKAVTSKALLADAARAKRDIDYLIGDDVRAAVAAILEQPPEILEMLASLGSQKIDLLKHTGPVTRIEDKGRKITISHDGKDVATSISGSRTAVTVDGKKAKRNGIRVGMTCTLTYPRPGAESKNVDCKS